MLILWSVKTKGTLLPVIYLPSLISLTLTTYPIIILYIISSCLPLGFQSYFNFSPKLRIRI